MGEWSQPWILKGECKYICRVGLHPPNSLLYALTPMRVNYTFGGSDHLGKERQTWVSSWIDGVMVPL